MNSQPTEATGGPRVSINADVGESIGHLSFGNDDDLLALVDTINVACGMHAGDPAAMERSVTKAGENGVSVGAHPGLPDLVGFGRREMALDATEVRDLTRYQVGALSAFLDAHGLPLDHIKPHGALYAMTSADESLMAAICDVAEQYGVAVFGLPGTAHERVARSRSVPFVGELYVDLDYLPDGRIVVRRSISGPDIGAVHDRVADAINEGRIRTTTGEYIPVRVDSVCVHSDQPHAPEVARAVRDGLNVLSV